MVDARVGGVARAIIRKGIGLETPNHGSSCKGSILRLFCGSTGVNCRAEFNFLGRFLC